MQLTDILPPIPRVRRLVVSAPDVADETVDFWIWYRSFQGLINREEPHLYLVQGDVSRRQGKSQSLYEEHWLDYYVKAFGLRAESSDDVDQVIETYKHLVNGYVVYDNACRPGRTAARCS